MADDKSKKGSPDNDRIDVKDSNELRNWAKAFDTTQQAIKDAVAEVGTSAAKVKKHLGK